MRGSTSAIEVSALKAIASVRVLMSLCLFLLIAMLFVTLVPGSRSVPERSGWALEQIASLSFGVFTSAAERSMHPERTRKSALLKTSGSDPMIGAGRRGL